MRHGVGGFKNGRVVPIIFGRGGCNRYSLHDWDIHLKIPIILWVFWPCAINFRGLRVDMLSAR